MISTPHGKMSGKAQTNFAYSAVTCNNSCDQFTFTSYI